MSQTSIIWMICILIFEPLCEKTNSLGSDLTKSDTNWAAQSQKTVRGWKFWI